MKYGLIGKTLVHSYSREIHEALGKYEYHLFSLTEEEMPAFIGRRDFGGLNVTIPYKQAVMPLCDEISELAAAIGAVNTLYWRGGRLVGHNTDYAGFLYAAKRAGIDFAGKNVLILGTGGTSLMARKAAADQGAAQIFLASRSGNGPAQGDASCRRLSYEALPEVAETVRIIVNTTPVGTFPNNLDSLIHLEAFPACEAVMDVIYNPFRTRLLLEAEQRGLRCSNGLPMLVAQATAAAGYFLDAPGAFEKENERIITGLQRQMQNIVLIGMPGSGKTTIAKLLSKKTGKPLVDTDEEIVKKAGRSIPEIFAQSGEAGFRKLETDTILELGKQHGQIIATGGGAVLRAENVAALRQNGLLLHILRPVAFLPTQGRPLSGDLKAMREMEKVRMPLYRAAADLTFDNSRTRSRKKLLEAVCKTLGFDDEAPEPDDGPPEL